MGLKEALGTNSDINKRKKDFSVGWILTIVVILVVLISIYLIYIATNSQTVIVDDWDNLHIKQKKIEDGSLIEITAHKAWADKNEDGFSLTEVYYSLSNNSRGYVDEISGIYDENETIIFNDNDSNNLFSNGDTFLISSNINENEPAGVQFFIMVNGLIDHLILN